MPVCIKCESSFPATMIIDGQRRFLNRRKYCLTCSPFGEHNTKRLHTSTETRCKQCGDTDESNFYSTKKHICKKCHNAYTLKKGQEKREYALNKLGNKCSCCGYDKYPCSLDIHHLDPSIKDDYFTSFRGWSYDRIDKEISECILLCKNCHAAHHAGHDIYGM